MADLFELPPGPTVPIAGSKDVFPVRRVFCVGRNYAAHAREMGKDPERDPPFFFTKFAETVIPSGSRIPYPSATKNFHFEAELVLAIGAEGQDVAVADATALIFGYAVGLDMTRRDLQLEARDKGRPWDTGKNFKNSAPIAAIHRRSDIGDISSGRISLAVNGSIKQDADIEDLIWNCSEIIAHLSALEPLHPGDLIFTGTPAGVGPVVAGDHILVEISGLTALELDIAD
ncbi:fumarylacetoacetate hydrolase family protein [Aquisediminimonas profunda]|uniref:fumarylacetoacetate hydrolase family protein n=1 Tax=Aquisediminimonas profunda TaxID=1550733 RepID=UPI001C6266DE|nr:fumarylacetoacetate hydrolase family protein [Aquisediminimonas profunda]